MTKTEIVVFVCGLLLVFGAVGTLDLDPSAGLGQCLGLGVLGLGMMLFSSRRTHDR